MIIEIFSPSESKSRVEDMQSIIICHEIIKDRYRIPKLRIAWVWDVPNTKTNYWNTNIHGISLVSGCPTDVPSISQKTERCPRGRISRSGPGVRVTSMVAVPVVQSPTTHRDNEQGRPGPRSASLQAVTTLAGNKAARPAARGPPGLSRQVNGCTVS